MTTNSEWLWKMGRENPGELTEWLKAEHVDGLPNGCEITHSFSERLYGVDVSDCPYCGCERIIIHDYNENYENPHGYRVEHMDEREACTEGCFEMYFAFSSVEDAVKHANMRNGGDDGEPFCEKVGRWLESDAPSECRECDDGKWRELHDQHESRRQDADQRERENMDGRESDSREKLEAEARRIALDFAANNVEEVAIEYRVIELLDRQAAITERESCRQVTDQREISGKLGKSRNSEIDSREKLEADFADSLCLFAHYAHDHYEHETVMKMVADRKSEFTAFLDRQATITRFQEAANQPNSGFVAQKQPESTENDAAKPEIRDFDDSREKLEADVNQYVMQQVNSTITWEAANEMKAAMLGMLDRQAAITERELCEGCDYKRANERQARKIHNVCEQNAELQAKVDCLVAENGDRVWHEPLSSARSDGSEPAADADEVADYVRKMDALLCRLTNGKFSKSWAYDVDFMESCVNEEFEALYAEEVGELRDRVGRLTAERDNLARDLAESERLREQLREKLGAACDHAHDLLRSMDIDEGLA